MTQFRNTKGLFLITALSLFAACGKKKAAPVAPAPPAPPPAPAVPTYNQNNTQNGCVGGVQTQNTFLYFGGSYDVVREQYMPAYQCMYGQVTTTAAVTIGATTIAAGTYSWQQMYDKITESVNACLVAPTGANLNIGVWAATDYFSFNGLYSSSPYLGSCAMTGSNISVTFQRAGVTSSFVQIYSAIANINSGYYSSLYRGGYYNGYRGPTYWNDHYNTNSIFGGVSYNSGSGLSLSLGGNYNFN